MPIAQTIDTGRRLVHVNLSGEIRAEECILFLHGLIDNASVHRGFDLLYDARAVARPRIAHSDIQELAAIARSAADVFGGTRWAIVTSSDLVFGLARMFAMSAEDAPFDVNVFRSEDDVWQWLRPAKL